MKVGIRFVFQLQLLCKESAVAVLAQRAYKPFVVCLAFAEEGAKVVAASRLASNGKPVVDDILKRGGAAVFVQCDVSREEDVNRLFATAIREYDQADILVDNAGVNFTTRFEDTEVEDWDRVINTDLRGSFLCTRLAIRDMLEHGRGNIINIATVHTAASLPWAASSDAAKWGLVGMTKALAVEYASRNIRVNALSPGLIDTQIWEDIQAAAPDLEQCSTYWRSNIPMGRVGSTNEIARVAVFLASEDSSYVTGANIFADGGITSQLISKEPYEARDPLGSTRGS